METVSGEPYTPIVERHCRDEISFPSGHSDTIRNGTIIVASVVEFSGAIVVPVNILRRFRLRVADHRLNRARAVVARALDRQYEDARDKMANRWYWHDVGRDVLNATQQAHRAIQDLPAFADRQIYLSAVLEVLRRVREEIRCAGDDTDGFKSGTIGDIQNDIRRHAPGENRHPSNLSKHSDED